MCREVQGSIASINDLLLATVSNEEIDASAFADLVRMSGDVELKRSQVGSRNELRQSYKEKWQVAEGFTGEINDLIQTLPDLKGAEYLEALALLEQLNSARNIAYSELGARECR
jgi:hypothetical protein